MARRTSQNKDDDIEVPPTPSESQEDNPIKRRKLTSWVWDHFTKIVESDGKEKAECNYCQAKLTGGSSAGTKHLWQHSNQCITKKGGMIHAKQGRLNFPSASLTQAARGVWIYNQEQLRARLAEMIILHEYPFAMAKHEGFIDFMRKLQPQFQMPGRKTVRNDCVQIFTDQKTAKISKLAKDAHHIVLTTNMWTASDLTVPTTGYMVVTLHYIDSQWELNKNIISFQPLPPPHSGQAIADRLSQVLQDWKLVNKVAFVTLNNAQANTAAMVRLKQYVDDRSVTSGAATSAHFHMRCLAHIINLVVKDGLKIAGDAVDRLRNAVHWIHGSPSCMDAFDKSLTAVGIDINKKHPCKDVPTRWNSTYLMIKASLPCKLAFQELAIVDNKFEDCPSKVRWDELVLMEQFLEPFYQAIILLSGTQYPMINYGYCVMSAIEAQLKESLANPTLTSMVEPMKQKFNKYWEPAKTVLAIGLFLDPRYKMRYLRYNLEQNPAGNKDVNNFIGRVKSQFLALWNLYVPAPSPANKPSSSQQETSQKKKTID
ncbi:hypothetical protein PTTG_28462 [Puccinia triticina 1-1 BBBD Race 1]|uniref:BED-type domain-containing protein n=1 Tax=Puccinia triticina (isolate 1-1 / race 1 (BBBD)) TaxID=630390 RepID=A0A180GC80_PUCT1|nr:hypothetical protein PTTG_28462 [Puccinia triticina 1-1 BBBD Race 1]